MAVMLLPRIDILIASQASNIGELVIRFTIDYRLVVNGHGESSLRRPQVAALSLA